MTAERAAPLLEIAEPITIADAARRAGVHPNTVRRLIRTGRVRAQLVRRRHGDTWLVDTSELDTVLGRTLEKETQGQTSSTISFDGGAEPSVAPFFSSATDLSFDRARALERFTHGLLQPLVDLLREREAALETRDVLIRNQAERIGRLERELELMQIKPAPVLAAASPSAEHFEPPPVVAPSGEADDLPEHVSSLASQVARLRAELQFIAAALRPDEDLDAISEDDDSVAAHQSPPTSRSDLTPLSLAAAAEPSPPPIVSPPMTPAVTPEELAGLFPATARGRLTLQPLDDERPTPLAPVGEADDPFVEAEAAVRELRRAFAPEAASAPQTPPEAPNGAGDASEVFGRASHPASQSAPRTKVRRWWWPW